MRQSDKGWPWRPAFTLVTDLCDEICLTRISPAGLTAQAHEASERTLARALVRKDPAHVPSSLSRVAHEPTRALLAWRRYTPLQKGCMRAAFCNGVWTQAERHQRGFAESGACALCGERDSLHHRLGRAEA